MFPFVVLGFLSLSFIVIRQLFLIGWHRDNCPSCGYSVARIKRKSGDHLFEKLLLSPIGRFKCQHYQCKWEGLGVYAPKDYSSKKTAPSETLVPRLKIQPREVTIPQEVLQSDIEQLEIEQLEIEQLEIEQPEKDKNLSIGDRLTSVLRLQRLLEDEEFVLYYQPKVNIKTHNIIGMEALLRWNHPKYGCIYPAEIIPFAEANNLMPVLEGWIFKQVGLQVKQWSKEGLLPLKVSVNISTKQFYRTTLISILQTVLEDIELAPQLLELEVSEATVLNNPESAKKILKGLQAIGISVAMDNVGQDSNSVRLLQSFAGDALAGDTLKIDPSLVQNLNSPASDVELVRALIKMAHDLNLNVVAGGVETRDQLSVLRVLGCFTAQGYLFDPPLSVIDATDVLQANWLGRKEPCLN